MDFENIVYTVDPDPEMSRSLAALLASYDIAVRHFADAESFLALADSGSIENGCVLVELDLPGADGLALLRSLMQRPYCPPVIVLGSGVPGETRNEVLAAGATDFIDRSLAAAYLFNRVSDLLPGVTGKPQMKASVQRLADGTEVTFRMMHPEDAEREQAFVTGLSERSRYLRFFSGLEKLPSSVLHEFTHPDYPYSYAVIAIVGDGDEQRQIGVARYAPTGTEGVAEFAVVVADDWQGRGIGNRLMRLLILAASVGGINRLEGLILRENTGMKALAERLGFNRCPQHDGGPSVALYVKDLRDTGEPA